MVKPGGTGRPRFVISARLAPLPPRRYFCSFAPSSKACTYFMPYCLARCGAGYLRRGRSLGRHVDRSSLGRAAPIGRRLRADACARKTRSAVDDELAEDRGEGQSDQHGRAVVDERAARAEAGAVGIDDPDAEQLLAEGPAPQDARRHEVEEGEDEDGTGQRELGGDELALEVVDLLLGPVA